MIPVPEHIEALIFDLDGTLADTMPIHLGAWKLAGEAFGVNIEDEMILDRSGMPTVKVAELLNLDYGWTLDPPLVKQAKDAAYKELKPQLGVKPIAVVFEVVEKFRGKLPMAIGTGSTRASAEDTLITMGLIDWFDAIVTASDVTKHKPEPETYLRCAELMKIAPEKCIVFEDAEFGIQAAQRAGMEFIDVRLYK